MVVFSHSSPTPVPGNVWPLWVYLEGDWDNDLVLLFSFSRSMTSAVEGWLRKIIEEWQMFMDSITQVVLLFL